MATAVAHWNQDQPAGDLSESLTVPGAMVNITNRCMLKCEHCFVFRDANPNVPVDEPDDDELFDQLEALRDKHGIKYMLWMGGEPMIRKEFLRRGLTLFRRNTITTNGMVPLLDYSESTSNLLYVVSLDGPERVNDPIRGKGVFKRVIKNVSKLPDDFPHVVQCQCVVTKRNQDTLGEFVDTLRDTRFNHVTFSFHVPGKNDFGPDAWKDVQERDGAVRKVIALKEDSGGYVRNRTRSLELMLSENNPKAVTDGCLSKEMLLPLYLEGKKLVTPFCCYGNDVDCDRCGAWVVFELAARQSEGTGASRIFTG